MGIISRGYWFRFLLVFTFLVSKNSYAQNVDLETFYKPNFKITGGVNANAIFYNSNGTNARDPFTYSLSGNLNVTAFSFTMPLFYSITNQGKNMGYTSPFNFNKLCLMPKYKWVKAYIGDVSMSFSPYTLNSFPFRGVGLELTPRSPFRMDIMGGRLLKAGVVGDGADNIPVYERWGGGLKMNYEKEKYRIGWIGFYAKDIDEADPVYDEKGVTPKENWVHSLLFTTSLLKNLNLNFEYALSGLTEDSRTGSISGGGYKKMLFSAKESTSFLNAVKANINYTIQKSNVGIAYEKVDPNYRTLGALFFSNDLENIVLTFSRPFYKNNIDFSANLGYQRDDLVNQKKQNTKRMVGTMNMNYKISERLNFNGTYSNFTTYTNKKLNQFDLINDPIIIASDTLDYRQLSQNGIVNVGYALGQKKNQNVSFNYTFSSQANEEAGIIRKGQNSTIQNFSLGHLIRFTDTDMALNSALNYTKNAVGKSDNSFLGGSVGISKKALKDKMNNNFGLLYNQTTAEVNSASVLGLNLNSNYIFLKSHNFTLGVISMFRNPAKGDTNNDITINFNYGYTF